MGKTGGNERNTKERWRNTRKKRRTFIGSNLVLELLRTVPRIHIVGIDNMNDYYDVSIKEYRLKQIEELAAETAKEQAGAGAAGRRAGSGKTVSRFRLDFCEGQHCG